MKIWNVFFCDEEETQKHILEFNVLNNKRNDKLGLSWAKLSSSWNWTLTVCRFGLSRFGLIVMIGLIFLVCLIE